MNLTHLKYAVVIAETNSMTKAAERLYTSQPNLSRSIRELESSIGTTIFRRTSYGIFPTPEGEEFLNYARKVIAQVEEMEALYSGKRRKALKFSISVPRASYISCAFTEFIKEIKPQSGAEIYYKETNALRAINNIIDEDYRLGIIRYQSVYDGNFKKMLKSKELSREVIYRFQYKLIFSERHPLAEQKEIYLKDLMPYVEIAHADPFVPSIPLNTLRKNELSDEADKHIFVFERGSQMDLLSESPNTFMWVSPIPERILKRYGLAQRDCIDNSREYHDALIYRQSYKFTKADKVFLDKLMKIKQDLL